MKKILSIDGGGIRGIIPGQILVALEAKIQAKTGNPDARIADYFDFFAGTSTGGILTCIMLCPADDDPKKAKFSAQEAVNLYLQNGSTIFGRSPLYIAESLDGVAKPKYEATGIEDCLAKYFGNIKLSQLLKPCIIPAYDIQNREGKFFAQQDLAKVGPAGDFYVNDVCRATSAAPTYFPPELITSIAGQAYACVDGGMFANNPALCAYSEVRNSDGQPVAKDMFVVSIGTGTRQVAYPYTEAKNWGAVGWVKPVIDILMAGASEVADYEMTKMFTAESDGTNYIRIQTTNFGSADVEMDDASAANLQALVAAGKQTAQNCPDLERIVDMLVSDHDPVTFSVAD